MTDLSGWIALDKPSGLSSAKAVHQTRRLLKARKAGHAGTLDPLAEGLLLIALGEATKAAGFLMESEKTYRFAIRWGAATDTDDKEGRVIRRASRLPSPSEIDAALKRFIGLRPQRPPAFSAIRVEGVRAYALARQGRAPALKARPALIHSLRRLGSPSLEKTELEMRCGKGVYVRALARDLGEALDSAAHLENLRRVAIGPFGEKDAVSLETLALLAEDNRAFSQIFPLRAALPDMPVLSLRLEEAKALREGRAIHVRASLRLPAPLEEALCLALHEDAPVGFVQMSEGRACPKRIFHPARWPRSSCAKRRKRVKERA